MLITLISILIAVTIVIIVKKKCDVDDDFCGWGCGIFTAFILTLLLHLVTYPVKLERPVVTTTQKITAMKYDSKVEGEMRGGLFFYRCRIDEVDYYVYLTEADGIYKQERVPVENTVIKETKGQPRVVKSNTYVQSGIPQWIRFKDITKKVGESDTLYVPEGTVSSCTKFEIF